MNSKIKNLTVLACFGAAAFCARAQVSTAANDIVLGFEDASGGSSNQLEVKLGSITQFATQTPGTTLVGNYSSLLSSAYGSSWASNDALVFGAIGSTTVSNAGPQGQPKTTVFITSSWDASTAGTLGVQNSTSYGTKTASPLGSAIQEIGKVYTGMTQATGGQTVAANAVLLTDTSAGGNTWAGNNSGSNAFNFNATLFNNSVTSLASGQNYVASDLWQVSPSNSAAPTPTVLGTFSLNTTTGDLYFTVIPEPSTYAAILGVATLGIAMIRRRKQAIAA